MIANYRVVGFIDSSIESKCEMFQVTGSESDSANKRRTLYDAIFEISYRKLPDMYTGWGYWRKIRVTQVKLVKLVWRRKTLHKNMVMCFSTMKYSKTTNSVREEKLARDCFLTERRAFYTFIRSFYEFMRDNRFSNMFHFRGRVCGHEVNLMTLEFDNFYYHYIDKSIILSVNFYLMIIIFN